MLLRGGEASINNTNSSLRNYANVNSEHVCW